MRIPEELLKAVCYVGVHVGKGEVIFGGTAFLIVVPLEADPQFSATYLVTARHVVEAAQREAAKYRDGGVRLRMNSVGGGGVDVFLGDNPKWIFPGDEGSDVALLEFLPPPEIVDFARIPTSLFLTREIADAEQIGVGDEIAMVGLFSKRPGASRNEPIVRAGILAATPSEPLTNGRTGAPMHGCYLAEIRSIGGLSGSPVFVFLPYGRTWTSERAIRHSASYYLLGLLHGHWNVGREELSRTSFGAAEEPLNTGIGVLIPITDVLTLLDSPEQIEIRRKLASAPESSSTAE